MSAPLYIVDAFAEQAFGGNPAAVVLLDEPRSPAWMQAVAAEMNLSETAFVDADPDGKHGLRWLRWFTPVAEVDLCGHATLATAHVLGGTQRFTTRSGKLVCTAGPGGMVQMDFPADHAEPLETRPSGLDRALPWTDIRSVSRGVSDLLVELGSAREVRDVKPDFAAMAGLDTRGVIVTAASDDEGSDFVSRCFYPAVGIPEDPVTGSAHCTLACWWGGRLGRESLIGNQLSARGGVVHMTVHGDLVRIGGRAVTVASGQLHA